MTGHKTVDTIFIGVQEKLFCKTMKRYLFIVAVAIYVVVGVFVPRSRSQACLTILVNGSPAANLTVTDFQARSPCKLDASGFISCDCDSSKQNAVLVPTGNGGQVFVSLSEGEHKTVDLRDRMVILKTVKYNCGFIRREETTEQYDLTDAEIAAIEAGTVMASELQESIRKAAERNMHPMREVGRFDN